MHHLPMLFINNIYRKSGFFICFCKEVPHLNETFLSLGMKRIYHLSSCNTCQRIIKELNPSTEVELIDVKKENIDAKTLDWLKEKVGSYEQLFSRRAVKFRSEGWNEKVLSESDYRDLMLKEYTFLKRRACSFH